MIARLTRAVAALVVLAAVGIGIAALLLAVSGPPWEAIGQLVEHLDEPLTDDLLVALLSLVVWVGWLVFVATVGAELAGALGAIRRPAWPAGPLHGLARWLVVSLTMSATIGSSLLSTPSAAASPPAGLPPLARPSQTPAPALSVALPAELAAHVPAAPAPADAPATVPEPVSAPEGYQRVTVGRGDSAWGLAERWLGDGHRWREIFDASRDLAQPDGRRWTHPEALEIGWTVLVPAPATEVVAGADASAASEHVVERGDTLWSICAQQYGREDAALVDLVFEANRGITDPEGRTLHDPDLIKPGMRLTLPPDPLGAPAAQPVAAAPVVDPGPAPDPDPALPPPATLTPAPAPATLTPAPPPATLTPAPPPAPMPPPATLTPNPAPAALTPAPAPAALTPAPAPATLTPAPAPATLTPAPAPATLTPVPPVALLPPPVNAAPNAAAADAPTAPNAAAAADAPAAPAEQAGESRSRSGRSRDLTLATLVATGALTLVDARRRRRLQRMGAHDVLPSPDPDLAAVDASLRTGADLSGVTRLDAALRALAAAQANRASSPARPELLLRHRDGRLEVHLDRADEPPEPWTPVGERVWALAPDVPTVELIRMGRAAAAPCPALVLLGRTGPREPKEVYLDLEAAGVVRLEGGPSEVTALARSLVAGLAVTPLADVLRVVARGLDVYGLANEERIEVVDDDATVVRAAHRAITPIAAALADEGVGSTFALRGSARHEPWEPTVVVALSAGRAVDDLAGVAGSGGRGLALVTDGAGPARWRLSLTEGGDWQLAPVGLTITPTRLAPDELADLGALLQDARAEPVAAAPASPPPFPDADAPPFVPPFVAPAWALQVRVLGPVDVVNADGKAASFEKSKALELVVWLAQHRTSATRSAARTALWETDVRDASFANVVSDARRALARLVEPPDGEEWIGRTTSDRLPLHRLVVTDADLVRARLDHARTQCDEDAVDSLREALEMVRDLPYAGTGYAWPDGEGLPSNLVLLATATAAEMAARCLRLGDVDGVCWATSQGLRVLPGHDELVCLRMQAHAAAGDLTSVRQEYEAYERVVLADPFGDPTPSPKVVACRRRLLTS